MTMFFPDTIYNVKDFQSAGSDTAALQAAADACHEKGGGTILIPDGEYTISSVRLYSNTTVMLMPSTRLKLDPEESHYGHLRGRFDDPFPRDPKTLLRLTDDSKLSCLQELFLTNLRMKTDCMFFCKDAENVTITGGTLDGQYPCFFDTTPSAPDPSAPAWEKKEKERFRLQRFRPVMIVALDCKNVCFRDMRIYNAPIFNIRIVGCDTARCEDLDILSDLRCINTDGINIGGSRHCFVSRCRIETGDDCIAVSVGEGVPVRQDCEDVIITGCIGSTNTNFVRVFSGIDADLSYKEGVASADKVEIARAQTVRNVIVSDCILEKGGCAVNIVATLGRVENVKVTNMFSRQVSGDPAAFIVVQNDGTVYNVSIEGLDAQSGGVATVLGSDRESVKNIRFRNCRFTVSPRTKLFGNGIIDPLVDYWMCSQAPNNFYVRHATGVQITDCEVIWREADFEGLAEVSDPEKRPAHYNALWRADMDPSERFPCICAYDVDGLFIKNSRLPGFGGAPSCCVEASDRSEIE